LLALAAGSVSPPPGLLFCFPESTLDHDGVTLNHLFSLLFILLGQLAEVNCKSFLSYPGPLVLQPHVVNLPVPG